MILQIEKSQDQGLRLLMISHRPRFQVCLHIRHLTAFVKTEEPGKGMTEKLLRYWTFLSDKSYTIAYVSDSETFDKYRPAAEAIISSVQLGSEIKNPPNSQQVGSENQESTTTQVRDLNVGTAPSEQKSVSFSITQPSGTNEENIFTINIGAKDSNSLNSCNPKSSCC